MSTVRRVESGPMLIDRSKERLFNLIIYYVKNTRFCYKTKLLKLLYFSDFLHFKIAGKAITALTYSTWEKGPVPVELYREIDKPGEELKKYVAIRRDDTKVMFEPLKEFDPMLFSKRELALIGQIAKSFYKTDSNDMVESTHLKNHPWDLTMNTYGANHKIDYRLALDGSEDCIRPEKHREIESDKRLIKRIFS